MGWTKSSFKYSKKFKKVHVFNFFQKHSKVLRYLSEMLKGC